MTDKRTLAEARAEAWEEFQKDPERFAYQSAHPSLLMFNWAYNAGHIRGSSLNSLAAYDEGYEKGIADYKALHGEGPEIEHD